MGNRTIGMIGVLSCLLGVNTVSYAGEAGNDVGKNHARWVVIQDDERVQNWMKQPGEALRRGELRGGDEILSLGSRCWEYGSSEYGWIAI